MRAMSLAYRLLAAAVSVAILAMPTADARPLDEVVAAKILQVIAYRENPPFSYEADAMVKGIDIDLARAIARELGVKAEFELRMPGETQDDDLRVNVWKGPLTGGGVGDIMMHVPIDREFAARNTEAVIGNAYFEEQVVVATHPNVVEYVTTFDAFKTRRIGVQLATVSDYFLMTYQDGALIENISHYTKPEVGIGEFISRDTLAIMGVRSNIEALLRAKGLEPTMVRPPMDGIIRTEWVVGMAWKENSRDLGYAIAAALDKITASGELKKIFETHGVNYVPPPVP